MHFDMVLQMLFFIALHILLLLIFLKTSVVVRTFVLKNKKIRLTQIK